MNGIVHSGEEQWIRVSNNKMYLELNRFHGEQGVLVKIYGDYVDCGEQGVLTYTIEGWNHKI